MCLNASLGGTMLLLKHNNLYLLGKIIVTTCSFLPLPQKKTNIWTVNSPQTHQMVPVVPLSSFQLERL